jgi:hypothetical protein
MAYQGRCHNLNASTIESRRSRGAERQPDLPLQYHSAKRGVNSEMRGDYSALVQRHLYLIILFHHRSYTIFIMSEGV